ncbi:uridine phosphorylase [Streptomyces sp. KhCrAH-43]|uniref:nucleoside phosphorylase n=1 Tax=unclassified Streptomyces TaxID=2593676 RepID=UPI00035D2168|nr:nucleoside phosphorylase [Streptomyces sp. KhCrAH-43]MYS33600.1 purine-nucleoside phosphorylase [Streptomyces sp. SID4920]MYX63807.1 purine-nucleoside phosphorylase [Streptomyces sp. SID8373]RAJ52841.1 uridine phosphorylase [Streptomyces sp. KhCrAH-43]
MSAPPPGIPLPANKHRLLAVTDPGEHAAYIRARHPGADLTRSPGVILLYQSSLAEHAARRTGTRPLGRWVSADLHRTAEGIVLCSGFGRGAPAAGLIIEQLIALGARAVITIGTAATLTDTLHPGDLVICQDALRGEGLSHHYLPPGRYAAPDRDLTDRLEAMATAVGADPRRGRAWTTDALYRESADEVRQYAGEGAVVADMEAAGVLAVARYRRVPAAAVFAVADSLVSRAPRTNAPQTGEGLRLLLGSATRALADQFDPGERQGSSPGESGPVPPS